MPCLSCAERRKIIKAYVARKLEVWGLRNAKPATQAQASEGPSQEAQDEGRQQAGEQTQHQQRAMEADKGAGTGKRATVPRVRKGRKSDAW